MTTPAIEIRFPCPVKIENNSIIVEWGSGFQNYKLASFVAAVCDRPDYETIEQLLDQTLTFHEEPNCCFHTTHETFVQSTYATEHEGVLFERIVVKDTEGQTHIIVIEEMPSFEAGDVLILNDKFNIRGLLLRKMFWHELLQFRSGETFTLEDLSKLKRAGIMGNPKTITVCLEPTGHYLDVEYR